MCIGTSWQDRVIKEGYRVSSEMEGACGLPARAPGPARGQGLDGNQRGPQDWHLPPCFSKILCELGSKSS